MGRPVTSVFPPPSRPWSSVQAMRVASSDSEASLATPFVGTKQSTAAGNVGSWSTPCVANTAILPISCVPPFHCSNSSAASWPFAATSVRRRSSPVPETSIQGVKSFPYGEADVSCTYTVAPVCAIIRLPNSVGCSMSNVDRVERAVGHRPDVGALRELMGQHEPLFE